MGWQYDYFLKDQLGNVRTVLTEQTDTARYMATFEIAARVKETALFANISETVFGTGNVNQGGIGNSCPGCIVSPDGSSYPADPTTQPNEYTSRLNGNGKRIGAAITLKVMAGDRVDIGTKVWYPQGGFGNNENPGGPEDVLASLLATLSNGAAGLSGNKATPGDLQGAGSPLPAGIANFLNSHPESGENEEEPRAYLNWMLLDEQFNYVPTSSGFIRVPGFDDNIQTLAQQGLPIVKSGYLFVYLSNETRNRDVFFDNLVVQHYTGPLTEETQYYPFGLTMAGISSKAVGRMENKKKFNGYEENKSFDLNWQESFYRTYDPQLGRFWQIDPKPNHSESPYAAMGNNPVLKNDPLGDTTPIIAPIFIPQKQMPNVYQNHLNYIKKHPNEAFTIAGLTFLLFDYEPDENKQEANRKANAKANPVGNKDDTIQEDEVAPACTKQGGARGVRMAVPKRENSSHGGQLGGAIKWLGMKDGDKFMTILIPDNGSPTTTPQTVPEAKLAFESAKKTAQQQTDNTRIPSLISRLTPLGMSFQAFLNYITTDNLSRQSTSMDEEWY